MTKKTAIYPGTFDPITHGHISMVERAVKLFDEVIVAIAASASKTPMFSLSQRVALGTEIFSNLSQVRVLPFSGLLVQFMAEQGACIVLRGIRTAGDMEYEFQLATANRCLMPEMETVFLKPDEQFAHVSSSIVREIAMMGGDLVPFVPAQVIAAFEAQDR